jgi:hypothetical protein
MPFAIGGSAALVALAAGILAHVDPITSLWRAALALVLGWVGANLWYVITTMGRALPDDSEATASPGEAGTS